VVWKASYWSEHDGWNFGLEEKKPFFFQLRKGEGLGVVEYVQWSLAICLPFPWRVPNIYQRVWETRGITLTSNLNE
jgi:hypothetical protein